jgi:hypothetical protein
MHGGAGGERGMEKRWGGGNHGGAGGARGVGKVGWEKARGRGFRARGGRTRVGGIHGGGGNHRVGVKTNDIRRRTRGGEGRVHRSMLGACGLHGRVCARVRVSVRTGAGG